MTGRRVVGGTCTAALLLLAACSTGAGAGGTAAPEGDPAPSPRRPSAVGSDGAAVEAPSLSASVVQYRRDAQRGVLQVKVSNDGDAPVHVTRVRLDTVTFTGPVEADKDSRIGPGVSADLTVPLGEAACGTGGTGPDATGTDAGGAGGDHVVTLEVDGGTVELPVGDEVLGPVAAERCAAEAVAGQVDLVVGPTWTDSDEVRGEPTLRGSVVATPQPGAGRVGLAVEGATTLFTVAVPSAAELPAGATEPVVLDVVLSVTRCDPHAVAEDKKGYLLPVRVSVDGADEVLVEVAVPVPERGPLQDLVDRTCGFP